MSEQLTNPIPLSPCLFCRDDYDVIQDVRIITAENGYEHHVECLNCGARGSQWDFDANEPDFQRIAKHWNKHVTRSK